MTAFFMDLIRYNQFAYSFNATSSVLGIAIPDCVSTLVGTEVSMATDSRN